MLLAITALGGSNATKTMLSANIQASDIYGYYQSKYIRQTVYQLTAEQLEAELIAQPGMPDAARTKIEAAIKRYRDRVDRYESDPSTGDGKKELPAKEKEFEPGATMPPSEIRISTSPRRSSRSRSSWCRSASSPPRARS